MNYTEINSLLVTLFDALRVTQGVDYKGKVTSPHDFTQLQEETFAEVNKTIRHLLTKCQQD